MLFEAAIVAFAFTTGALESAQPVRLGAPGAVPDSFEIAECTRRCGGHMVSAAGAGCRA